MKILVLPIHSPTRVLPRQQEPQLRSESPRTTGDEALAAFDAFYCEWIKRVLGWLRALGVKPSELDDVTQEVFLRVHRLLPGFDGNHPAAWLYQIANNVARNHRRSAWLRRLVFSSDAVADSTAVDEQTTPQAQEAAERLEGLRALLDRMEPKRRAALWMFEVEGMTGEEVAEAQGVPLNTVWSRLRLARQELAKLVQNARRASKEYQWP